MSELNPFGALEKRGVRTDAVSLNIPDDFEFKDFEQIGDGLTAIAEFSHLKIPWYIGDWICYGQKKFPDTYEQAIEFTGLKVGTLYNYAYVCRNVRPNIRRETLGLAVHQEVAKIKDEEKQSEWLSKADTEGWTKMELRRAIQGLEPRKPIKVDDIVVKQSFDEWFTMEVENHLLDNLDGKDRYRFIFEQGCKIGVI